MSVLVTGMMLFLAAAPFHQTTAIVVSPSHTSTFFDPAKHWMGETTLHGLFGDDTIAQLQKDGFIKTRQNPDHPDRTQYFVVKTPADAELISTQCSQKHDSEDAEMPHHEEANVQNFGKEWINSEKLRAEYGDDRVEELVKSGHLDKRQHPDFPEQTQLGKEWLSTQSLLEQYGFDKVEELLISGGVEKRQNPNCPERTQYFVKEELASPAQTEEEVQEAEASEAKSHDGSKLQKHVKPNRRDVVLHKHGYKNAEVQQRGEATAQQQDEPKLRKHGKAKNHKHKMHQYVDEEIDVQEHEEAEVQNNGKRRKDADVAMDSDVQEKSAAVPAHVLSIVVTIITSAFFV